MRDDNDVIYFKTIVMLSAYLYYSDVISFMSLLWKWYLYM